jgi:hypothetical protein
MDGASFYCPPRCPVLNCVHLENNTEAPDIRKLFCGIRVGGRLQFERSSWDMASAQGCPNVLKPLNINDAGTNFPDELRRKPNLPPKPGLTGLKSIKCFGWRGKVRGAENRAR